MLKLTVITRGTAVSSGIVASAIDIVGALSSSAIVSSPIASLMVTFDGLDKVTMTVSSTSLILSETTVIGIFLEVSPALNVRVVVDTAV